MGSVDGDFVVCRDGQPCRRAANAQQQPSGTESASIVQRLEDLMRRVRDEGHALCYRDLIDVREGPRA